jgi:hypothetical protein
MNSFVVLNRAYDGTSGDPNPLSIVTGKVNSKRVYAQTLTGRKRIVVDGFSWNAFELLSKSADSFGSSALDSSVIRRVFLGVTPAFLSQ